MHVLIVHCHPEPASFNAALTEVARTTLRKQGFSVEISDLYRQDFDPCERPEHYTNRGNDAVSLPWASSATPSKQTRCPMTFGTR